MKLVKPLGFMDCNGKTRSKGSTARRESMSNFAVDSLFGCPEEYKSIPTRSPHKTYRLQDREYVKKYSSQT